MQKQTYNDGIEMGPNQDEVKCQRFSHLLRGIEWNTRAEAILTSDIHLETCVVLIRVTLVFQIT